MEPPEVGAVIEVSVTRLDPFGAWVEYAGRTGLVVIPEVSWARINHPADVLSVGQRVRVKVLTVPNEREFAASVRAVHPEDDPWFDPSRFAPGTVLVAPVVRVLEYGCFVEVWPQVWALLRREGWLGPLAVGDRVRVRVVSVDPAVRKAEVSQLVAVYSS